MRYLYLSPHTNNQQNHHGDVMLFLHGYGSNCYDFLDIARNLRPLFPNTAFMLLDAPEAIEGNQSPSDDSFQWFSLADYDATSPDIVKKIAIVQNGVTKAVPPLQNFIDITVTQKYGYQPSDIILFGFSQGAMMVLDAGLRKNYKGVIACAGMLAFADDFANHYTTDTPVLLCHGKLDDVVPVQASEYAYMVLQQQKVNITLCLSDHAAHHLDNDILQAIIGFMRNEI
ncbi:MAG: prolyl oligopeptidase family serine peptidase [Alphaproteobacteria bacterium]|nr:prolyl oligopeptidase family serine peptidase [Alphaproteobacteria bacterium]